MIEAMSGPVTGGASGSAPRNCSCATSVQVTPATRRDDRIHEDVALRQDGPRLPSRLARETAEQGRGDDVEDRGQPVAVPVRARHPRAATPQELDDAHTVLVVHRLVRRLPWAATK